MNTRSVISTLATEQPNRRELLILATLMAAQSDKTKNPKDESLIIVDGWVVKKSEFKGFFGTDQ